MSVTPLRATTLAVGQVIGLAIAYVAAAKFGLGLDAVAGFATLVWAPTGIAIASLLLFGLRLFPGVFLGAFAVNLWVGAPILVALGIAVGNTAEALVAAYVLQRVLGFRNALDRNSHVLNFLFVACVFSTLVSATVGVGCLLASGIVEPSHAVEAWRTWWLGDAVGAAVVAPLLLAWLQRAPPATPRHVAEQIGLVGFLVAASALVFIGTPGAELAAFQQPYVLFLVAIWASLRFGPREATAITFLLAGIAIAATTFHFGPFAQRRLSDGFLLLQAFIAIVAVMGLVLTSVVAEREAHARELERVNAELQEAVRARDAFLSVAAHELRTPIGALRLQTQMLVRRKEGIADDLRDKLGRIDRQTLRLNRLIDNLLEVSRIAAGRLQPELERVDLGALAREVASRGEDDLRRANCTLHIETDEGVIGEWDPMRLEQVVSNLLSNAAKYGAGKPVELEVKRRGQFAHIVVRDHGIGIAPEDQPRIFERFERLVSRRQGGGLGLGLWIARQITEAMGGTIRLVSALGSGSMFVVELPLPENSGNGEPIPSDLPIGPERPILIVEDDGDTLEAASEVLQSAGYRVSGAVDGWQALEAVRRERPRLIVLDLTMPVMDGRQFLVELRRDRKLCGIPVVLMSADRELKRASNDLGGVAYVEKPVDMDLLLATVERHGRIH